MCVQKKGGLLPEGEGRKSKRKKCKQKEEITLNVDGESITKKERTGKDLVALKGKNNQEKKEGGTVRQQVAGDQ